MVIIVSVLSKVKVSVFHNERLVNERPLLLSMLVASSAMSPAYCYRFRCSLCMFPEQFVLALKPFRSLPLLRFPGFVAVESDVRNACSSRVYSQQCHAHSARATVRQGTSILPGKWHLQIQLKKQSERERVTVLEVWGDKRDMNRFPGVLLSRLAQATKISKDRSELVRLTHAGRVSGCMHE
jgi:hypothetical protein